MLHINGVRHTARTIELMMFERRTRCRVLEFPIANRAGRIGQIAQVNWRRGLFRLWLLLSAAWIMGWTVYIVVIGIKDGFQSFGDLFAIPVLLIGPPVALFLFGVVARWAFRGFAPD